MVKKPPAVCQASITVYVLGFNFNSKSFRPDFSRFCPFTVVVFLGPLAVTERWRHNYDVFPDSDRTQPFGSGATVAFNYIDLQITNETNSTFQLL